MLIHTWRERGRKRVLVVAWGADGPKFLLLSFSFFMTCAICPRLFDISCLFFISLSLSSLSLSSLVSLSLSHSGGENSVRAEWEEKPMLRWPVAYEWCPGLSFLSTNRVTFASLSLQSDRTDWRETQLNFDLKNRFWRSMDMKQISAAATREERLEFVHSFPSVNSDRFLFSLSHFSQTTAVCPLCTLYSSISQHSLSLFVRVSAVTSTSELLFASVCVCERERRGSIDRHSASYAALEQVTQVPWKEGFATVHWTADLLITRVLLNLTSTRMALRCVVSGSWGRERGEMEREGEERACKSWFMPE